MTSVTTERPRERSELKALRIDRGYTQDQLGEEIGKTGLTISRYERGVSTPQGQDKRRLARALNISMNRLNSLLIGAPASDDSDIEDDDDQLLAPRWFNIYFGVERSAARLESFQPHFIHGLLQTEEYARALIEPEHSHDQVERLVRLRMSRKSALLRDENPLHLIVVLSEGAIRCKVATNALMRRQIAHLLEMAERPNITVRILPFSAGSHIADRGAFTLLTQPWEDAPNVLYIETYLSGASYVEEQPDIRRFSQLFARLRSMSLPADETLDMIRELEEELYK